MEKPTVFLSGSATDLVLVREIVQQLEPVANVLIWPESASSMAQTRFESLTEVASRADFAVFLLEPDNPIPTPSTNPDLWAPRSNVVFELGFLAGYLGVSRIFVIVPDRVLLPSDLTGMMYIVINSERSAQARIAPAAAAIRKAMAAMEARPTRKKDEYYSCFISYSWADQAFAERLHDDLSDVGVRAWLDAKDLKLGDRWVNAIDRAIQKHDKVLLILSATSVASQWVRHEVRNSIDLERRRGKTVIFPIRLDDAIFEIQGVDELDKLKQRLIGDFRNWHDKSQYRRAFSHLVKALAISASVEAAGTQDAP